MKKQVLFILLVLFSVKTFSQAIDCGCTHTIPDLPIGSTARAQTYDAVGKTGTICIPSGTRVALTIKNVLGTVQNPVIIKNCGGEVFINSTFGYGFQLLNCKYFTLDGSLTDGLKYGIRVSGGAQNITCTERTTDGTIRNVHLQNASNTGLMWKSDPYCATTTKTTVTKENFVMENVLIENCFIEKTGSGEGMYIGYTFPTKTLSPCGTVVNSHRLRNITIRNNITERTGADGIQVSQCEQNLQIYGNEIYGYGKSPFANFQNSGIALGALNVGTVFNNKIDGLPLLAGDLNGGNSMSIVGTMKVHFYNNICTNSGELGMYIDPQNYELIPSVGIYSSTRVFNNLFHLKTGNNKEVIQIRTNRILNSIGNNVMIGRGEFVKEYTADVNSEEYNNIKKRNFSEFFFADTNTLNFHLTDQSSLLKFGNLTAGVQVNFDFDSIARTTNFYSAGPFEFVPSIIPNISPVAITTPFDTVFINNLPYTLVGSGTDTDGEIIKYNWITNNSIANLNDANSQIANFSALDTGKYIFTFTVTDNKNATNSVNKQVYVKAPFVFEVTEKYKVRPLIQKNTISTSSKDTLNDLSIEIPAGDTVFYKYSIKHTYTNINGSSFEFKAVSGVLIFPFSYGTKSNNNLAGNNFLTGYFINTTSTKQRVHLMIVANGLLNNASALAGSFAEFYTKE